MEEKRSKNREARILETSSRHMLKLSRNVTGTVLERVVPSQVLISSRNIEDHDPYVCRQLSKGRVVGGKVWWS